jgi:hypothetical protein
MYPDRPTFIRSSFCCNGYCEISDSKGIYLDLHGNIFTAAVKSGPKYLTTLDPAS